MAFASCSVHPVPGGHVLQWAPLSFKIPFIYTCPASLLLTYQVWASAVVLENVPFWVFPMTSSWLAKFT